MQAYSGAFEEAGTQTEAECGVSWAGGLVAQVSLDMGPHEGIWTWSFTSTGF